MPNKLCGTYKSYCKLIFHQAKNFPVMKLKFSSTRSQNLARCPHNESVNPFTEYKEQYATFLNLFISVRCSTRFR